MKSNSLIRKEDSRKELVLAAAFLVSVVAALALPFLAKGVSHYESLCILFAPFVALGAWRLFVKEQWIPLAFMVAIPGVLAIFDWRLCFIGFAILLGMLGIVSFSDLVQRRVLLRTLEAVEHCGFDDDRNIFDKAVGFIFGIPDGMDGRDIKVNKAIERDNTPWVFMFKAMIPALLLMLFIWIAIDAGNKFHASPWNNLPFAITLTMYAIALTLPWSTVGTMNVRVESSGLRFKLFNSLTDTMIRMIIPTALCLIIIIFIEGINVNALQMIALSAVFFVAIMIISLYVYEMDDEAEFVQDMAEEWKKTHPVDFYSGFDGKDGRHPLNDGVPGTPRRSEDSCFPVQKN